MFSSGLQGHTTAYWFLLNLHMQVFGDSVFGARMFGVLLGTLAVPAVYVFLRVAFSREVAMVSGILVAGYHLAVHYSRQDLNNIADLLALAVVGALLVRAVADRRDWQFVALGATAGLSLYLNVGTRVLVPVIGLVFAHALLANRDLWRDYVRGGLVVALAFVAALAPQALHWAEHPEAFGDRMNAVGIVQSGWLEREVEIKGVSRTTILWQQVKRSVGILAFDADTSGHYRSPQSLIGIWSLPFFAVGLAIAVVRSDEARHFMLLSVLLLVLLLGAVLIVPPPQSQRVVGVGLPVVAFTALGILAVARVADRLVRPALQRDLVLGGALAVAAVVAALNLNFYFGPYREGDYFSDFNTRIVTAAGQYASALPGDTRLYFYGAPHVFTGHPAFTWNADGALIYDVLEDGRIVPEEPPGPARAAFVTLQHRRDVYRQAQALCPGGEAVEMRDDRDRLLFYAYLGPPGSACSPIASELGRSVSAR
jgi:4-amino-4-deoxy-L-arabinose transferase-like glycosyltransferase